MDVQPPAPSRPKRSLTRKGLATRTAILETAHQVFRERGYYGSSISEITRRCGISMGNFYQYFRNKEQVFLELNELIISRFRDRVENLPDKRVSFQDRLRQAVHLLFQHIAENFTFHRILGESELIDRVTIAHYEAIARTYRLFFRREARAGHIRSLDPGVIAYGLIGICYFHSLDWGEKKKPGFEELVARVAELIYHGINGPLPWKKPSERNLLAFPDPVPLRPAEEEALTKGENTRQSIFRAAEKVLGRHGINRANISEITREAGVAQGTFYVHFKSKRDLIVGFVKYINRTMRRELQRAVARTQDRRDAERVGVLAFFQFLQNHREIYRVVPECEMIDREVGLWYYRKLAAGYIRALRPAIARGEVRNLPPVFLARSLMGFTHFIGLKWVVWNTTTSPKISRHVLKDMIEFLLFGLRP